MPKEQKKTSSKNGVNFTRQSGIVPTTGTLTFKPSTAPIGAALALTDLIVKNNGKFKSRAYTKQEIWETFTYFTAALDKKFQMSKN
mgnify:CR=1 FL=1